MKPSTFFGQTKVLQPPKGREKDITTLPVYTDGDLCISCWRPTLRERLSVALFGRVWVSVLGGPTQPPISVWAERAAFKRA